MDAYKMQGLNLELTTCCPLHCPQCYCSLTGGKHLDFAIAKARLKEASAHGVQIVHLSGGETMCYPHLFELIEYASSLNIKPNIAISGYRFDRDVLDRLVLAGVNGIFVSLNGSTKEINEQTTPLVLPLTLCDLAATYPASDSCSIASRCFIFMYFLLPHWVPAT